VLLPQFLCEDTQRELVRWALRDHARAPNITNLDTHYILPPSGLWNAHLFSPDLLIQPLSSMLPADATPLPPPSGPRTLIANTPASPATLAALAAQPKPLAPPSATVPSLHGSALLAKLRWANIGWFYHWGTKQYDFVRGAQPVGARVREICREAVGAVPWDLVFGNDAHDGDGWGEGGADWARWDATYGTAPARHHQGGNLTPPAAQSPTRASSTSTRPRTHSWRTSTAPRSARRRRSCPFRASALRWWKPV
jgi:alkylated DNA repair protein alkB family protein 1